MRALLLCSVAAIAAVSWAQAHPSIAGQDDTGKSRAGSTGGDAAKARQLLQHVVTRQPVVNVRMIIMQRAGRNSNIMQQIKVEMSKDGKIHQIVLAPLSVQGTALVDNGVTTWSYTPDDHCIIEQPSSKQTGNDLTARMNLVTRNYTLRIDGKEKIAGRIAIVVVATPRNDELEKRLYSIDERTGLLLRLDTSKDGQAPITHFETRVIQFPAEFSDGTFRMDAPLGVIRRHFDEKCVSPASAARLAGDLGFTPVVPSGLPFGFEVQELQASSHSDSGPALVVRVSDGLAKATVVEWRSDGNSRKPAPEGTRVAYAGGMAFLISGDLPDEVEERLLTAFVRSVRGNRESDIPPLITSRDREPDDNGTVFSFGRYPKDMALFFGAFPDFVRI